MSNSSFRASMIRRSLLFALLSLSITSSSAFSTRSCTAFIRHGRQPNVCARLYAETTASSSLSANQEALVNLPQFPRTFVPLASVYELNPDRPNAVEFLGQTYIVYAGNNDQWIVTDSVCPHRLAPLAEGRIERNAYDDVAVECSYHGWSFNTTGHCVRIPQANEATAAAAMKNPACKLQTYSVIVEKNILFAWLWPDQDPLPSMLDSSSSSSQAWVLPEHMLEGVLPNCTTYTRDLPYGWDTLLENIVDPSHVPWAHHGLQGTRNDAIAINMTRPGVVDETGFEIEFGDRTMGMRRQGSGVFRAPFVIQYNGVFEDKPGKKKKDDDDMPPKTFNLTTVLIPTKPGWSRIIIIGMQQNKSAGVRDSARKESLVAKIFRKLPPWLAHTLSNRFLDSDLAVLHFQDRERPRRLIKTSSTPSAKNGTFGYFMPAKSDRCVVALRNWVQDYAHVPGSSGSGGSLPPLETNRRILFDRWAQHSDQCRHCNAAATSGVTKWRNRTYWLLSVCVVLHKFLVARLGVVGCLFLLRAYNLIEQSLKEGGFKHYEND